MEYELIHVNIGLAKYPLDSEEMASFWALEKPIYEAASRFNGFIRDLDFPDRFSVFPQPYIFNATAWSNVQDLKEFVYTGLHSSALKDRKQWFKESPYPKYVLFWAPADFNHTEKSCSDRVSEYMKNGPTSGAFDFKNVFQNNA